MLSASLNKTFLSLILYMVVSFDFHIIQFLSVSNIAFFDILEIFILFNAFYESDNRRLFCKDGHLYSPLV